MLINDLLSDRDLIKIHSYIKQFSNYENNIVVQDFEEDSQHLFRYWLENKSEFLLKLFNNKMIYEYPIDYTQSEDEFIHTLRHKGVVRRFENDWFFFCKQCVSPTNDCPFYIKEENFYDMVGLLDASCLVDGKYNKKSFTIYERDDSSKKIVINTGCRIIKTLQKLHKKYCFSRYFENFVNQYSTCLGNKNTTGYLCLSIHPLDYMTMSDNASNWHSCMSWQNNGSYRAGTVEMMNSPNVIVAYLKGSTDLTWWDRGSTHTWNNKKWRSLYIVTPQIITNVKGYPYQDRKIDNIVLNLLKDLAIKNCNIKYSDNITYSVNNSFIFPLSDKENQDRILKLDFYTDVMYNDFSSTSNNICCTNISENFYNYIIQHNLDPILNIPYSGPRECMCCGEVAGRVCFSDSDRLLCDDCEEEPLRCSHCDEIIYWDEDYYNLSDYYGEEVIICENCYKHETEVEFFSGNRALRTDLTQIKVVASGKIKEGMSAPCIEDYCIDTIYVDYCSPLNELKNFVLKEYQSSIKDILYYMHWNSSGRVITPLSSNPHLGYSPMVNFIYVEKDKINTEFIKSHKGVGRKEVKIPF